MAVFEKEVAVHARSEDERSGMGTVNFVTLDEYFFEGGVPKGVSQKIPLALTRLELLQSSGRVNVADIQVGKNSQVASSGEFNALLLHGRGFRLDIVKAQVQVALRLKAVDHFWQGKAKLTFTNEVTGPQAGLCPFHGNLRGSTNLVFVPRGQRLSIFTRTQLAGRLREVLCLPDVAEAVKHGLIEVSALMFDIDREGREVRHRKLRINFDGDSRRIVFPDNDLMYVSEVVELRIRNKDYGPRLYGHDFLLFFDVDPNVTWRDGGGE